MDLNQEELELRITEVVAKRLGVTAADIPRDASFESLGFDSMDSFDMLFTLEDEFGISIDDEQARQVSSVASVVQLLKEERSA